MKVRTKSILGPVHTRARVVTSILTSVLTVNYLSPASFAATSGDCEIAGDRRGYGERTFYLGPLGGLGQRNALRRRKDRDRRGVLGSGAAQRRENSTGVGLQRNASAKTS